MLDFEGHDYVSTYPIRIGEKFVMSGECFNTISDLGENHDGYPSYGFNDHENVFGEKDNAVNILFLFEYIGNGKVRENSTGRIFEIRQCDWICFTSCYERARCAYPTYQTKDKIYTLFSDGEFENHPEALEVKDVVDYIDLNYAVAYYKNNPLVIAYDLVHVSSLDDIDSKNVLRKYNSNTDEQRVEFINKYTKIALQNIMTFGPILEKNAKRLGIINTRSRRPKN